MANNSVNLEIMSKYAEGKKEIEIIDDLIETEDAEELTKALVFLNNMQINPYKQGVKLTGNLININISKEEKEQLAEQWAKTNITNILLEEKVRELVEEKPQLTTAVMTNLLNTIDNLLEEDENDDETCEIGINEIKQKEFELKMIALKFLNIFKTAKVYDNNNCLTFIYHSNSINIPQELKSELLNIATLLKIKEKDYKFHLAISPQFDFNDENNEDSVGVDIFFEIEYNNI